MTFNIEEALASKAWPFQEAEKLSKRFKTPPEKGYVLFQTGYGPSGLPHIGTFGEVFRTTMVQQAFERCSDIPTKLFAFSDDMDGLRKVPDTIPNPEKFLEFCPPKKANEEDPDVIGGVSLTAIPDPFGTHESFGAHMNNRLQTFLDQYGFSYEFKSATECYKGGVFDDALRLVVKHHEEIANIVKPTLSEKRRVHYSPILPIDPETHRPLQVDIEIVDAEAGIIRYQNPLKEGAWQETPVTGGNAKLQWRADWAMRWVALGVDYEMHGKDLIPSAELSAQICKVMGSRPPQMLNYELFLDEHGAKISKSKGNGISLDDWLRYGTPESLSLFMYQSPQKAKRLYFDVIPKHVDEYLTHVSKIKEQEDVKRYANPAWHIHNGEVPELNIPISFNLLLNLASACNPEDSSVLWGFISRYAPEATPDNAPLLNTLVEYAINYYEDFVKPNKQYRAPTDKEREAMEALKVQLESMNAKTEAETIQNTVYAIGKEHGFENLREWFGALYEVLLGVKQGPRMGSFIALYGVDETAHLIARALQGEDLAA